MTVYLATTDQYHPRDRDLSVTLPSVDRLIAEDTARLADGYLAKPALHRIFNPLKGKLNKRKGELTYEYLLFTDGEDSALKARDNAESYWPKYDAMTEDLRQKVVAHFAAAGAPAPRVEFEFHGLGDSWAGPTAVVGDVHMKISVPLKR